MLSFRPSRRVQRIRRCPAALRGLPPASISQTPKVVLAVSSVIVALNTPGSAQASGSSGSTAVSASTSSSGSNTASDGDKSDISKSDIKSDINSDKESSTKDITEAKKNEAAKKPTAIKASVSLAVLFFATAAGAASIGTVTDLDGNLLVSRANGSVKVLAVGSAIEAGDILTSRQQTYATLTLADESFVTLGPGTDLKVQRYAFDKQSPDNDGALFALANGSVRITAAIRN